MDTSWRQINNLQLHPFRGENMRNRFIAVLLSTTIVSTAAGQLYIPYYPGVTPIVPEPAMRQNPAVLLRNGVNRLIAHIKQQGTGNPAQTMAFVERVIAPYFDFGYMTRWAAGPAYRELDHRQRAELEHHLKKSFLTILVQGISRYANQQVRLSAPEEQEDNRVTVRAWITQENTYPIKVEFRFHRSNPGWKIFDVSAAGYSALVFYRDHFKRILSNNQIPRM